MAEGTSRPVLITILGILKIVLGVVSIIAGIIGAAALADILEAAAPGFGALGGLLGGVMIVTGIIDLLLGIGYMKGWKAVWYIALIFYILGIIGGILSFPAGLIMTIIYIILVWYFFRPEVKAWFGKE